MAGQSRNSRAAFKRWLKGRPGSVRAVARTIKPWKVYRIVETGQHCHVVAYSQDSSVRVNIIGHDNEVLAAMANMAPLQVFGIKPHSLQALRA